MPKGIESIQEYLIENNRGCFIKNMTKKHYERIIEKISIKSNKTYGLDSFIPYNEIDKTLKDDLC